MSRATGADDREALLRYVERFAIVLADLGLPRMAARVFAYAVAEDADTYTAADLATGLRISPAAVSGAVRYLVQIGMLAREREPGSRSDHYRIHDKDVWGMIASQRLPLMKMLEDIAAEGARLLRPGSPGARRMRETQEFCAFLLREYPKLLERWADYRRTVLADLEDAADLDDAADPDSAASSVSR